MCTSAWFDVSFRFFVVVVVSEEFNNKVLTPELSVTSQRQLHDELQQLWSSYISPSAVDTIRFQPDIVQQIHASQCDCSFFCCHVVRYCMLCACARTCALIFDRIYSVHSFYLQHVHACTPTSTCTRVRVHCTSML